MVIRLAIRDHLLYMEDAPVTIHSICRLTCTKKGLIRKIP